MNLLSSFGLCTRKRKHSSFPTFLQCAAVTVGHRGAVPSTIFVRKLLKWLQGESADSVAQTTAIDDLAKIDAHSAAVARTVHYDASDMIDGGVIKKSVRAFLSFTKRLPVELPEERVSIKTKLITWLFWASGP